MKILYDYQAFTMQKFGGVSKCFCELISKLPKEVEWNIAIKESDNIHLDQFKLVPELKHNNICADTFISKRNFKGKIRLYNLVNHIFPSFPSSENLNKRFAIQKLKESNYDIFHPTFFKDYFLPYLNKKPFVLTIHDMMPELFPEYFRRNDMQILMKRKLVKEAGAIIAVSNQTKNDIIRLLGVNPNKISVIYHGGPKRNDLPSAQPPIINGDYILYVGSRYGYKNFAQFLRGFSLFAKNNADVKLICTGKPFTQEEQHLISSLGISKRIVQYFVSDIELTNLYAHALVFVYPSMYEGFGMPILEAYAYGCPVILSNCSCFPEIAGNAALYFDTENGEAELASRLQEIYNYTDKQRKELIQLGYERLSHYTWEKSSKQLVKLYESLL